MILIIIHFILFFIYIFTYLFSFIFTYLYIQYSQLKCQYKRKTLGLKPLPFSDPDNVPVEALSTNEKSCLKSLRKSRF